MLHRSSSLSRSGRTAVLVALGTVLEAGLAAGSAGASTDTTEPAPSATAAETGSSDAAETGYSATITYTEYGIPHITADTWGSLGFGQGYAFSHDRACTLLDQIIKVRGERAAWFGPGTDDANINSDLAYRQLGLWDDADERFTDVPDHVAEMVEGYVAGVNRQLEAEGPNGWCEGEPWVQPITTTDLYAQLNDILLFASSGVLIDPIATAQPPGSDTDSPASTMPEVPGATPTSSIGSNGWAIGSGLSESGGGMLLANPHFPWEGEKRLWENQLTLTTGELDVYGITLTGTPGVLIGFNDAVSWTHTVSAGYRMTMYELTLDPADPTRYTYGDETREMTPEDITIDVLGDDGTTTPVTRTMWSSHYGPMLNLPFGWTTEKAYTYRDANLDNGDFLGQFLGMNTAGSMDEFIEAHREFNGVPWVNTIATSADGRAWYADTAATPNLSPEAIATWQAGVDAGALAAVVLDNGAILLDGSDPANEWVDDPAATRPGILPFDDQPQLERDDFVFNANDSHWLANPAEPLTGYSPLTGPEGVPQSSRTRMNAILLTDETQRGNDGTMSLADLQGAWLSNRALQAELLRDQVVKACEETPSADVDGTTVDLTEACGVLRDWDGRLHVDSQGAILWRRFLSSFEGNVTTDAGALYLTPFDPEQPILTPNTLADPALARTQLARAVQQMTLEGLALDIPLGDLQFDGRLIPEPTGVPGGSNLEGAASIVGCCSDVTTLGPIGDREAAGYPITFGNSFVMTIEFTEAGPHAEAVLTYGQPDDSADPNFTAQMNGYAAQQFRPIFFAADEVAEAAVGEPLVITD